MSSRFVVDRCHFKLFVCAGFHVVIGGQKFFAFQNYTLSSGGNATSFCGLTNTGFFHDAPRQAGVVPSNWGCYYGIKATDSALNVQQLAVRVQADEKMVFVNDKAFADAINAEQRLWTATHEHPFNGMLVHAGLKRMGKYVYNTPMAVKPHISTKPALSATQRLRLPDSFDWRDTEGGNYVCPVRDQGQCGSCYSFGSTGSLCSRSNVLTKGAAASQFWSPQTVVSCSQYSQGCDGGFSYNVFKYGEDFGIPWDTCFPVSVIAHIE
jgi:cathepsin C